MRYDVMDYDVMRYDAMRYLRTGRMQKLESTFRSNRNQRKILESEQFASQWLQLRNVNICLHKLAC